MNDLVTHYMGAKYVYDQHGNVIEKHDKNNVIKFEWNTLNQLTSVVLSDSIKTSYTYDVFGRRITKRSQYHASQTSNYQEIHLMNVLVHMIIELIIIKKYII